MPFGRWGEADWRTALDEGCSWGAAPSALKTVLGDDSVLGGPSSPDALHQLPGATPLECLNAVQAHSTPLLRVVSEARRFKSRPQVESTSRVQNLLRHGSDGKTSSGGATSSSSKALVINRESPLDIYSERQYDLQADKSKKLLNLSQHTVKVWHGLGNSSSVPDTLPEAFAKYDLGTSSATASTSAGSFAYMEFDEARGSDGVSDVSIRMPPRRSRFIDSHEFESKLQEHQFQSSNLSLDSSADSADSNRSFRKPLGVRASRRAAKGSRNLSRQTSEQQDVTNEQEVERRRPRRQNVKSGQYDEEDYLDEDELVEAFSKTNLTRAAAVDSMSKFNDPNAQWTQRYFDGVHMYGGMLDQLRNINRNVGNLSNDVGLAKKDEERRLQLVARHAIRRASNMADDAVHFADQELHAPATGTDEREICVEKLREAHNAFEAMHSDVLMSDFRRWIQIAENTDGITRELADLVADHEREVANSLSVSRCLVEESLGRRQLSCSQTLADFHQRLGSTGQHLQQQQQMRLGREDRSVSSIANQAMIDKLNANRDRQMRNLEVNRSVYQHMVQSKDELLDRTNLTVMNSEVAKKQPSPSSATTKLEATSESIFDQEKGRYDNGKQSIKRGFSQKKLVVYANEGASAGRRRESAKSRSSHRRNSSQPKAPTEATLQRTLQRSRMAVAELSSTVVDARALQSKIVRLLHLGKKAGLDVGQGLEESSSTGGADAAEAAITPDGKMRRVGQSLKNLDQSDQLVCQWLKGKRIQLWEDINSMTMPIDINDITLKEEKDKVRFIVKEAAGAEEQEAGEHQRRRSLHAKQGSRRFSAAKRGSVKLGGSPTAIAKSLLTPTSRMASPSPSASRRSSRASSRAPSPGPESTQGVTRSRQGSRRVSRQGSKQVPSRQGSRRGSPSGSKAPSRQGSRQASRAASRQGSRRGSHDESHAPGGRPEHGNLLLPPSPSGAGQEASLAAAKSEKELPRRAATQMQEDPLAAAVRKLGKVRSERMLEVKDGEKNSNSGGTLNPGGGADRAQNISNHRLSVAIPAAFGQEDDENSNSEASGLPSKNRHSPPAKDLGFTPERILKDSVKTWRKCLAKIWRSAEIVNNRLGKDTWFLTRDVDEMTLVFCVNPRARIVQALAKLLEPLVNTASMSGDVGLPILHMKVLGLQKQFAQEHEERCNCRDKRMNFVEEEWSARTNKALDDLVGNLKTWCAQAKLDGISFETETGVWDQFLDMRTEMFAGALERAKDEAQKLGKELHEAEVELEAANLEKADCEELIEGFEHLQHVKAALEDMEADIEDMKSEMEQVAVERKQIELEALTGRYGFNMAHHSDTAQFGPRGQRPSLAGLVGRRASTMQMTGAHHGAHSRSAARRVSTLREDQLGSVVEEHSHQARRTLRGGRKLGALRGNTGGDLENADDYTSEDHPGHHISDGRHRIRDGHEREHGGDPEGNAGASGSFFKPHHAPGVPGAHGSRRMGLLTTHESATGNDIRHMLTSTYSSLTLKQAEVEAEKIRLIVVETTKRSKILQARLDYKKKQLDRVAVQIMHLGKGQGGKAGTAETHLQRAARFQKNMSELQATSMTVDKMFAFWRHRFVIWYEEVRARYGDEVVDELQTRRLREAEAHGRVLLPALHIEPQRDSANSNADKLSHTDAWEASKAAPVSRAFEQGFSALNLVGAANSSTKVSDFASPLRHMVRAIIREENEGELLDPEFLFLGNSGLLQGGLRQGRVLQGTSPTAPQAQGTLQLGKQLARRSVHEVLARAQARRLGSVSLAEHYRQRRTLHTNYMRGTLMLNDAQVAATRSRVLRTMRRFQPMDASAFRKQGNFRRISNEFQAIGQSITMKSHEQRQQRRILTSQNGMSSESSGEVDPARALELAILPARLSSGQADSSTSIIQYIRRIRHRPTRAKLLERWRGSRFNGQILTLEKLHAERIAMNARDRRERRLSRNLEALQRERVRRRKDDNLGEGLEANLVRSRSNVNMLRAFMDDVEDGEIPPHRRTLVKQEQQQPRRRTTVTFAEPDDLTSELAKRTTQKMTSELPSLEEEDHDEDTKQPLQGGTERILLMLRAYRETLTKIFGTVGLRTAFAKLVAACASDAGVAPGDRLTQVAFVRSAKNMGHSQGEAEAMFDFMVAVVPEAQRRATALKVSGTYADMAVDERNFTDAMRNIEPVRSLVALRRRLLRRFPSEAAATQALDPTGEGTITAAALQHFLLGCGVSGQEARALYSHIAWNDLLQPTRSAAGQPSIFTTRAFSTSVCHADGLQAAADLRGVLERLAKTATPGFYSLPGTANRNGHGSIRSTCTLQPVPLEMLKLMYDGFTSKIAPNNSASREVSLAEFQVAAQAVGVPYHDCEPLFRMACDDVQGKAPMHDIVSRIVAGFGHTYSSLRQSLNLSYEGPSAQAASQQPLPSGADLDMESIRQDLHEAVSRLTEGAPKVRTSNVSQITAAVSELGSLSKGQTLRAAAKRRAPTNAAAPCDDLKDLLTIPGSEGRSDSKNGMPLSQPRSPSARLSDSVQEQLAASRAKGLLIGPGDNNSRQKQRGKLVNRLSANRNVQEASANDASTSGLGIAGSGNSSRPDDSPSSRLPGKPSPRLGEDRPASRTKDRPLSRTSQQPFSAVGDALADDPGPESLRCADNRPATGTMDKPSSGDGSKNGQHQLREDSSIRNASKQLPDGTHHDSCTLDSVVASNIQVQGEHAHSNEGAFADEEKQEKKEGSEQASHIPGEPRKDGTAREELEQASRVPSEPCKEPKRDAATGPSRGSVVFSALRAAEARKEMKGNALTGHEAKRNAALRLSIGGDLSSSLQVGTQRPSTSPPPLVTQKLGQVPASQPGSRFLEMSHGHPDLTVPNLETWERRPITSPVGWSAGAALKAEDAPSKPRRAPVPLPVVLNQRLQDRRSSAGPSKVVGDHARSMEPFAPVTTAGAGPGVPTGAMPQASSSVPFPEAPPRSPASRSRSASPERAASRERPEALSTTALLAARRRAMLDKTSSTSRLAMEFQMRSSLREREEREARSRERSRERSMSPRFDTEADQIETDLRLHFGTSRRLMGTAARDVTLKASLGSAAKVPLAATAPGDSMYRPSAAAQIAAAALLSRNRAAEEFAAPGLFKPQSSAFAPVLPKWTVDST